MSGPQYSRNKELPKKILLYYLSKETVGVMRDDFPEKVKKQLEKRVNSKCSNPNCRQPTSGPSLTTTGTVNMGVAAHITAASPGGARFDDSLTSEQRRSYDNGIWLCKHCGDLVDKDEASYAIGLLRSWKSTAEERAGQEVHRLPQSQYQVSESEKHEDRLDNWVRDGKKRWDELLAADLDNENPSRYKYGHWIAAYQILGTLKPIESRDLRSLLTEAENHRIGKSGYTVWAVTDGGLNEFDTYPYENLLECWMGKYPRISAADSHFWRVSPDGSLFLLRGYQEDSEPDKIHPGTVLSVETQIRDVTEILLHAQRLSRLLMDESISVIFRFVWEGLNKRKLASELLVLGTMLRHSETACHQASVPSCLTVPVKEISSNLPGVVESITTPLYQSFNFYKPSLGLIRDVISQMIRDGL
jgi:hypothetical protein